MRKDQSTLINTCLKPKKPWFAPGEKLFVCVVFGLLLGAIAIFPLMCIFPPVGAFIASTASISYGPLVLTGIVTGLAIAGTLVGLLFGILAECAFPGAVANRASTKHETKPHAGKETITHKDQTQKYIPQTKPKDMIFADPNNSSKHANFASVMGEVKHNDKSLRML